MSEQKGVIKLPEGDVGYTIRDVANLILKSATLTGILVSAITRVAREIIVQGFREITVTINDLIDEVVAVTYAGKVRRKQMRIAIAIKSFDTEITRVENSPDFRYKDLWISTLEQALYDELARIRQA